MNFGPASSQRDSIGSTSTGLIDRIRTRDEAAWERLVRIYGPLVHHWCISSGLQETDRADVFQEVFRAVNQHIDSFRRDRPGDSFRAWLRTITRTKIIDHFRRRGREPAGKGGSETYQVLLESPDETPDAQAGLMHEGEGETRLVMQAALQLVRSEFAEKTWDAFWRTTADAVPTSVVAEQLQMKPAAVRQAKSRVLRRLREYLYGLEELEELWNADEAK